MKGLVARKTTSKCLRIRPRTCVMVGREQYLRDDVSVPSELPPEATLVIPRSIHLSGFLELFEWLLSSAQEEEESIHIVLLETCLRALTSNNKRALELAERSSRASVFANEFCAETYVERTPGETLEERDARAVLVAAEYLRRETAASHRVLILDDLTTDWIPLFSASERGEMLQLHETLQQIHENSVHRQQQLGDGMIFSPHLSMEEVEQGIASGELLKGTIYMLSRRVLIDREVSVEGAEDRNRALEGDTVAYRLIDDKKGQVVSILSRNRTSFVCSFDKGNVVTPMDRNVPRIRVQGRNLDSYKGKRLLVSLDSWLPMHRLPDGHVVRIIGDVGDVNTEMDCILLSNNLLRIPFSGALLGELPDSNWQVSAEDKKVRVDLRTRRIFSIDPPGSQDIDDALSVEVLANGNYKVGVHIADVTSFVPEGSVTDMEARRRTATVYLADRRINMIPELLSEQLISLRGGVDRRAVSIVWELDSSTLEIKSEWFGRSLIRSLYEMSYNDAHALLNDQTVPKYDKDPLLVKELKNLVAIGRKLEKKRKTKGGAVKLESVESEVKFEKGRMLMQEDMEIKDVVAEFMILANSRVGTILHSNLGCALLRKHPAPFEQNFEELGSLFDAAGLHLAHGSSEELAASLGAAENQLNSEMAHVLRSAATLAMNEACYVTAADSTSAAEFHHYGLGLEFYTHFTSPIRRYADVLVHRQLLSLDDAKGMSGPLAPKAALDAGKLRHQCLHINKSTRSIKVASRDSTTLFQCLYFRDVTEKSLLVNEGIVSGVQDERIQVYIPRYKMRVSAAYEEGHVRLFDRVVVEIDVSDDIKFHIPRLTLKLLNVSAGFSTTLTSQGKGIDIQKVVLENSKPDESPELESSPIEGENDILSGLYGYAERYRLIEASNLECTFE